MKEGSEKRERETEKTERDRVRGGERENKGLSTSSDDDNQYLSF